MVSAARFSAFTFRDSNPKFGIQPKTFLKGEKMNRKFLIWTTPLILLFSASLLPSLDLATAQTAKIKMANGSSPPILDSITPYVAVEAGIFKK